MPLPTIRGRLGADEVSAWETGLAGAWELLVRHHVYVAGEVSAAVRVLTPLSAPTQGTQVSATSRETFGCVGVSTAADPLELAATLAHEVQHAKLYQIVEVQPLTLPDSALYYAPWRDDPRPLAGLLQGAYAYLGVTGFWRAQRHVESGERELRAHAEFARWRAAIATVTRTLQGSGRLTPAGEAFVSRMAAVAGAWCAESVPPAASARARAEAGRHARRWHAD
jgi:HEXXH motif-containing protein